MTPVPKTSAVSIIDLVEQGDGFGDALRVSSSQCALEYPGGTLGQLRQLCLFGSPLAP